MSATPKDDWTQYRLSALIENYTWMKVQRARHELAPEFYGDGSDGTATDQAIAECAQEIRKRLKEAGLA